MSDYGPTQIETIQAVVDRVTSWQDGAPESTVASELRKGFAEADVEVAEQDIATLADAIETEHAEIDAAAVLG